VRKKNTEIKKGSAVLRTLDRYFGIPIVWILGVLRKKRNMQLHQVNKIALLKINAIGDTVLLSAAIKDIREKYPNAKITLFAGDLNYEIAGLLPGLDEIIKLPLRNPFKAIIYLKHFDRYDLWIDFGPWPRLNAILSYFARADIKLGFNTEGQYRHYLYDISVQHSKEIHECNNYKNLLKPIGVCGNNLPSLLIDDSLKQLDDVVIHMFPGGSKAYLKKWPDEKWIQLMNYFINDYEIYLTGAKRDRSEALSLREKIENKKRIRVVAGEYSLKQTVELLKKSKLVISVDTGIMHIASALDCNLILLQGPTSANRWGPLNHKSVTINKGLSCSPCLHLGFENGCGHNKCMDAISVEDVVKAKDTLWNMPV